MSALPQIPMITVRPILRPAFQFAPSFDAWMRLNREALSDYAYDLAMAVIDEDVEPVGFTTFARGLYNDERSRRGLPRHLAAEGGL